MKKLRAVAIACLVAGTAMFTTGCAMNVFPGGPSVTGIIYSEVTVPAQYLAVALDADAESLRQGESSSMAFLGLFAFGDGGIDAAMKDGGITRVHHVDHTVQHFLYAAYAKDKVIVYGE